MLARISQPSIEFPESSKESWNSSKNLKESWSNETNIQGTSVGFQMCQRHLKSILQLLRIENFNSAWENPRHFTRILEKKSRVCAPLIPQGFLKVKQKARAMQKNPKKSYIGVPLLPQHITVDVLYNRYNVIEVICNIVIIVIVG